MLPQQAIFENGAKGEIKKISEPVQVYTACYSVKINYRAKLFSILSKIKRLKYYIPKDNFSQIEYEVKIIQFTIL